MGLNEGKVQKDRAFRVAPLREKTDGLFSHPTVDVEVFRQSPGSAQPAVAADAVAVRVIGDPFAAQPGHVIVPFLGWAVGPPVRGFRKQNVIESIPFSLGMQVHLADQLSLVAGFRQASRQGGWWIKLQPVLEASQPVGIGT